MRSITDPNQQVDITDAHIEALDVHLTTYITSYLNQGMMASADGTVYGPSELPYVVMLMLNEPMHGTITAGFIGYIIGKKLTVKDTLVNVPRALMLCSVGILRKYEDTDTTIAEFIADIEQSNADYAEEQAKEIPDNVTPILH